MGIDKMKALTIFALLLLALIVWRTAEANEPRTKICKNLRTGEIVVIEAGYPCPPGTVAI